MGSRLGSCLLPAVGQIGPGKAGCLLSNDLEVHPIRQFHFLDMDLEDGLPSVDIGPINQHLTIEPPGSEQSRVQGFRAVGGRQNDHANPRVKAVHFNQKLIQGLLSSIVTTDSERPRCLADGVQFIDKDDSSFLLVRSTVGR
jgi:hypothetical protein